MNHPPKCHDCVNQKSFFILFLFWLFLQRIVSMTFLVKESSIHRPNNCNYNNNQKFIQTRKYYVIQVLTLISKLCTAGVEITDFQTPDKTSRTIKYLPDILRIHRTSCLGSRVQTSPTCLPAKIYYDNFWHA